jgi:nucleoside-diphosphate-sugar epimerase
MGTSLVTGATGFTGAAVCRRLLTEGERVVAFVRSRERAADLARAGVDCRVVDIRSPREVAAAFTGIDVVYHIAAAFRTEHADRDEFRLVNVEATRNLLDAAGRDGVRRFVHCSTVGVQGEITSPPADESAPFNPGDHYQQTKLDGELLARERFAAGLPGAVVRPVGIYGPGDRRFLKIFRPVDRGVFVMIGSGRTLYHMTYIDDLVEGILLAARRDAALGEVFTIAGPRYTTIRELVDAVADALGRRRPRWRVPFLPVWVAAVACERACRVVGVAPPLYPRRVEFFHKDRAFSIEKARRLLGYEPRVDLREGLAATAASYRQQGWI